MATTENKYCDKEGLARFAAKLSEKSAATLKSYAKTADVEQTATGLSGKISEVEVELNEKMNIGEVGSIATADIQAMFMSAGSPEGAEQVQGMTDRAARQAFDDRWLALSKLYAGNLITTVSEEGKYGIKWKNPDAECRTYFVSDLTYAEALACCQYIPSCHLSDSAWGMGQRVGLPPVGYQVGSSVNLTVEENRYGILRYHDKMEVLILALYNVEVYGRVINKKSVTLQSMAKLKAIIGTMATEGGVHPLQFLMGGDGFPNLEHFRMRGLYNNFWIGNCPKLSLATIKYLIDYAKNPSPITVTVHKDIYAKLTDESNAEWNAVTVAALARNITFATT